jgi:hypothetical protein
VTESKFWRLRFLQLTRDGVPVAGYVRRIDYDNLAGTQTITGGGQQTSGVWVQDDPATIIDMLTPNSCCIYKLSSGNANMFAWASADYGGTIAATAPDILSGVKFSFDPETGSYNRRIVKWF